MVRCDIATSSIIIRQILPQIVQQRISVQNPVTVSGIVKKLVLILILELKSSIY